MKNVGITIWGTKSGRKIFFTKSVDYDKESLRRIISDTRGIVPFNKVGVDFYSIGVEKEFTAYSRYHTIYDWSDSFGYVDITIFMPNGTKCREGTPLGLLNEITDDYIERYIDKRSYRIKNIREGYEEWLQKGKYIDNDKFSVCDTYNATKGKTNKDQYLGIFFGENNNNLVDYFKYADHHRTTYQKYRQVFFINEEWKDKRKFQILNFDENIPAKPRVYSIKYQIIAGSTTHYNTGDGLSVRVQIDDKPAQEKDLTNNLYNHQKVKITFSKAGYKDLVIEDTIEELKKRRGIIKDKDNCITIKENLKKYYTLDVCPINGKEDKIQSAEIKINNQPQSSISNLTKQDKVHITISKLGYTTQTINKTLGGLLNPNGVKNYTITLQPMLEKVQYTVKFKVSIGSISYTEDTQFQIQKIEVSSNLNGGEKKTIAQDNCTVSDTINYTISKEKFDEIKESAKIINLIGNNTTNEITIKHTLKKVTTEEDQDKQDDGGSDTQLTSDKLGNSQQDDKNTGSVSNKSLLTETNKTILIVVVLLAVLGAVGYYGDYQFMTPDKTETPSDTTSQEEHKTPSDTTSQEEHKTPSDTTSQEEHKTPSQEDNKNQGNKDQLQLNPIITFANDTDFTGTTINNHLATLEAIDSTTRTTLDYTALLNLKGDSITNAKYETLKNRLTNMQEYGKNSWLYTPDENKNYPKNGTGIYQKNLLCKIYTLYKEEPFSKKQNTVMQIWLNTTIGVLYQDVETDLSKAKKLLCK